ncbi:MAG: hypothetical protein A3H06_02385 [Candidatus Colwellbacteria bacterium RIFCSPLOWO2_12_FULL_44_13]|uniref:Uncharacterized protein n=2 Tax=Candidatus Colwelliibacteriota TaxID=1817904 RepID=A0A1G1Z6H9_9BACT|nr:MAG: hypothetical protein A3I31_00605 [Candidatus Colwellbacteria bacterium RIFCSPLOWO2_02_FULL_44_20b]OGY62036.1 MAG: hypothetical protein A3H06_02385 [Candidatus Colwellbacteria bacterium RIFCSPLOWO2_12_FULL_44_13]
MSQFSTGPRNEEKVVACATSMTNKEGMVKIGYIPYGLRLVSPPASLLLEAVVINYYLLVAPRR